MSTAVAPGVGVVAKPSVNIEEAVSRKAVPMSSPVTAHKIAANPSRSSASHVMSRTRTNVGAWNARNASFDSHVLKTRETRRKNATKGRATQPAIRDGVSRGTTNELIKLAMAEATR